MAEVARMDTSNISAKRRQRLKKSHSLGGHLRKEAAELYVPSTERLPGAPDSPPPMLQKRGSKKKSLVRTDSQFLSNYGYGFGYSETFQSRKPAAEDWSSHSPVHTAGEDSSRRIRKTSIQLDSVPIDIDMGMLSITQNRPPGAFLSCPDLGDDNETKSREQSLPSSRSFQGAEIDVLPQPKKISPSTSRLKVPDIFTTSYTHSRTASHDWKASDSNVGTGSAHIGVHRHSAPDLKAYKTAATHPRSLQPKPLLAKSLSDTPPRRAESAKERYTHHPLPRECLLQHFRSDPVFSGVVDFLYIGNLESAYNVRLHCKLGIGSIVDLSNMPPEEVPASKKNEVPCTCSTKDHIAPAVLRLSVCESDLIDIQAHFPKINKFIEGAREKNKKALVVCYTGTSLSVLVVIQYLLNHNGMDLRKAYSQVMKGRSDIELNYAYFQLLQSIERQLYPSSPQRRHGNQINQDEDADAFLPKEAWSEC